MDVSPVQVGCGVFAIVIPLLLIAGFHSQLLLDRLDEPRDELVMTVVAAVGTLGEAAALIGVVRPERVLEAVAALCTAVSGTGVLLTVTYLLRLRARRRAARQRPAADEAP